MFDEEVKAQDVDHRCMTIERSVSLQDFRRAFFFVSFSKTPVDRNELKSTISQ